jgi:hypothetical protein
LRPDGVSVVPWTYLEATQPEGDAWAAAVHSGIRRPFGVRRRGQVQQLALVLRAGSPTTTVRFHARNDPAAALVGYEAFVKTGEQTSTWVGVTDSHGELVLPRGHDPIATLLLRSDGLLLAKVPVPVGALTRIEAPIADDGARLRAQAELRAIREELIDLVAQRAILMARVRAQLAAGKTDAAAGLMEELNELPLQSTFDRRIETAARAAHSDDPLVQGRIDKLFGDTRALLSKFLNVRQITDLQNEVLRAQSAATAPPSEDPPPPQTPEPR